MRRATCSHRSRWAVSSGLGRNGVFASRQVLAYSRQVNTSPAWLRQRGFHASCLSSAVTLSLSRELHWHQRRGFGADRDSGSVANADGAVAPPKVTLRDVVGLVAKNLWPEGRWDLRGRVAVAVTFVFATKGLRVLVPFWFKSVVDALVPATAAASNVAIGPWTLGMFGMVLAYGLTRTVASLTDESKRILFVKVNNHATNKLALRVFHKLHSMDLTFHLTKQTGSLARDLERGSHAFSAVIFDVFFALVPTAIEIILVCSMLTYHGGPQFATVAFLAVAGYFAYTFAVSQIRIQYREELNDAESRISGHVVDSLVNYETVKYFNSEKHEGNRLYKHYKSLNQAMVKVEVSLAVLNFGQQLIFIAAATTCLYMGATSVLAGTMTVGDIVLVDALLIQMYQPLSFLGMIYRELTTSTKNMERMIGLLKCDLKVKDAPNAADYVHKDGTIEFRDVSFGYNKERRILHQVSFVIPGGTSAAFVGASGSGKSTIFRLIFRFFDPTSGRVLIDGQDIGSLKLDSVRQAIGVIPQDTVMFNDTIRANIEYGKFGCSDAEIEWAAKASSFDKSVERFPQRYETIVGERGLMLSGGEKQRLAIARVLLKGSPILLADEATSALDSKTESDVMKTLNNAGGRKRTLVMIAHRLSTIQNADQIFVLNRGGELAEHGTHSELLAKKGIYYRSWMRQLKEAEIERGTVSNGVGQSPSPAAPATPSPATSEPSAPTEMH